jgi:hypothetical protein
LPAADQLEPVSDKAERQQRQKNQTPRRYGKNHMKKKRRIGSVHGNRAVHVVKRYFLHAVPHFPFAPAIAACPQMHQIFEQFNLLSFAGISVTYRYDVDTQ